MARGPSRGTESTAVEPAPGGLIYDVAGVPGPLKPPSPLVGFNNNVKHKGRIFHVQTEDSGVNRPRITTHLFADGGRIVKTARTDYSEYIGRPDMSAVVRRLMKEQHKGMFIALRDGQLDELVDRICGPVPQSSLAAGDRFSLPPMSAVPSSVVASADLPNVGSPPAIEPPPPSQPLIPRRPAPTLTDLVLADLEGAKPRAVPPPKPPRAPSTPGGGAANASATAAAGGARPPRPPSSRYAAPRPAAIFSSTESQGSLFGGGSISEKSLDEVILSYLAEDLDGPADK